jgi:hypothetical protein
VELDEGSATAARFFKFIFLDLSLANVVDRIFSEL